VKNPFSKDISEPTRRRLELAVAVAQERLLGTHVDHALRLIQLVGERVPFENALGIYTRLLRLSDDEARVITTRALATLGERAANHEPVPELVSDRDVREAEAESGGGRGFLSSMRNRMRGRVNDDLRRWVEMMAARTEVAILDTHVENALNFVDLLDGELPATDAIEQYLEALQVRDSISEITYYIALSRMSAHELPESAGAPPVLDRAHSRGERTRTEGTPVKS
jgi:hypothetical protein